MNITDDDIDFLEANREHHDTLVDANYMRGLPGATRDRMQQIIREYWQPQYHTDLWCGTCVADMVKLLYRLYDQTTAVQQDDPRMIIIRAIFPSNKPEQ